jgi:hypothetical protein
MLAFQRIVLRQGEPFQGRVDELAWISWWSFQDRSVYTQTPVEKLESTWRKLEKPCPPQKIPGYVPLHRNARRRPEPKPLSPRSLSEWIDR